MIHLQTLTSAEDLAFFEKVNLLFPEEERFEIKEFLDAQDKGLLNIYKIVADCPIGFSVISVDEEAVFIFYLAFDKEFQSQGYGSEVLNTYKELFKDKQLILEVEKVDNKTPFESLRMRRRRFYLKNHFHLSHYETHFKGVDFQVMCTGKDLKVKSFKSILSALSQMGYMPALTQLKVEKK